MNLFDILLASKMRGGVGGGSPVDWGVSGGASDGEVYAGIYLATGSIVIE